MEGNRSSQGETPKWPAGGTWQGLGADFTRRGWPWLEEELAVRNWQRISTDKEICMLLDPHVKNQLVLDSKN